MLTSRGARVAGGPLTRAEAIARFAPTASGARPPKHTEAIHLLLTTDLLSEGVNLQDADTVIHLDIPWTAARMEQRVGRLARLGSACEQVHIHVIRPPPSAASVLNAERTVERKRTIARAEENTPRKVERLHALLKTWRANSNARANGERIQVGAVFSEAEHFIAAVSLDGANWLLVGNSAGVAADLDSQLTVCAQPMSSEAPVRRQAVIAAVASIQHWCVSQRAASAAEVADSRAIRRRALLARIDQSIESAAPHRRSARLQNAARARRVVTASQCADVERELAALLHATMGEEEWLAAVTALETRQAISIDSADESARIHALLLLTVKRPRSRQQPDRGSL